MGLFGKKVVCPICGNKIKGDVLITIKDNVPLCKSCSAQVNMDNSMLHEQTVEDMRTHLRYREDNQRKFDNFETAWSATAGAFKLYADKGQRLWYCTSNKKDKNPPLFGFDELESMVYLEDGGEPAEELKTGLGALFGGKSEVRTINSMQVRIKVDNPYHKEIVAEVLNQEESVQTGTMTYKKYRKALQGMVDILTSIKGYVEHPDIEPEIPTQTDTDVDWPDEDDGEF